MIVVIVGYMAGYVGGCNGGGAMLVVMMVIVDLVTGQCSNFHYSDLHQYLYSSSAFSPRSVMIEMLRCCFWHYFQ